MRYVFDMKSPYKKIPKTPRADLNIVGPSERRSHHAPESDAARARRDGERPDEGVEAAAGAESVRDDGVVEERCRARGRGGEACCYGGVEE